ncbi:MAG: carbamoyltransferase HypF [Nanobdellota archaeon]
MFYRYFIKGVVQGVGFRPYIYRKAKSLGLKGTVKNIGSGVEVICDDPDFIGKLDDLPPLAKITESEREPVDTEHDDFRILKSESSDGATILPADVFMCEDCRKELRDKKNRRHNFYFITCTNCGPRFSMIEDYPYDRPYTSMKDFEMCEDCRKEYTDPMDRRYHAQTIACKKCGPKLSLKKNNKVIETEDDQDTIRKAMGLVKEGHVISIKGVGGYHICSLTDDRTVKEVRRILGRKHKPFALMVKDIEKAKQLAMIDEKEEELLKSPERPIVAVKKKEDNLREVSELDTIGIMLPYTALHYMLFDFIGEPLIMTSCNLPGLPVETKGGITDYSLTHEREIVNRCDDSVMKVISGKPFLLRRSRGFAPMPVTMSTGCSDTIALGGEINNVICSVKDKDCYLSQHIGNTSKEPTLEFMKDTLERFIRLTRSRPRLIVCDKHPGYKSTELAEEFAEIYGAQLIRVQHHKAHIAGVASEHGLSDYVGIAIDGLGYGDDGAIWGGEIFDVSDDTDFERIGHLEYHDQLGDSATRFPKRMLVSILSKFMSLDEILTLEILPEKDIKLIYNATRQGFNVIKTTSAGRVLDSVSALLGFCEERTYEGRPAILLEANSSEPYDIEPKITEEDGKKILSTSHLFEYLIKNLDKDRKRLAATAQLYIAKGLYRIASEKGKPIVLSGGVAYNTIISSFMISKGVLLNNDIPAGDGGLCYGQAYLANLIHR